MCVEVLILSVNWLLFLSDPGVLWTTWQTTQLAHLSQLLLNDLLTHDFRHASQILSAFVHRMEELPEVVWKVGTVV